MLVSTTNTETNSKRRGKEFQKILGKLFCIGAATPSSLGKSSLRCCLPIPIMGYQRQGRRSGNPSGANHHLGRSHFHCCGWKMFSLLRWRSTTDEDGRMVLLLIRCHLHSYLFAFANTLRPRDFYFFSFSSSRWAFRFSSFFVHSTLLEISPPPRRLHEAAAWKKYITGLGCQSIHLGKYVPTTVFNRSKFSAAPQNLATTHWSTAIHWYVAMPPSSHSILLLSAYWWIFRRSLYFFAVSGRSKGEG